MEINVKSMSQIESVILCKLSKIPIGELQTTCVTTIERTIDTVDRITLKINKYSTSQDGQKKIENPLYKEIKPKRYLLLNDSEYFIIEDIKENKLTQAKEVTALSGEQILNRRLIMMEDFGVQILEDDIDNEVYSLNTLLSELNWELNHVDETIIYNENETPKMRWQESVNTNWLEFMRELSEQFEFIPVFDTMNRKIDLLDANLIGEEIKICLSKDNYIRSKERVDNSEELITLLKLKGSEELDIASYILGGYDFIMNFSYFKKTHEMSDELIRTLDKYDEMIEIRTPQWKALVEEKVAKETELTLLRNQWQMSISTIDCYKRLISQYILKDMIIEENETRVKLSGELDNELLLRLQIEDLINEITLLNESIDNINLLCKFETCTDENGYLVFNEDTLNELLEFIFVDIYEDDSFVDADEMLEKGKNILNERAKPTVQVSIDSINFLNRIIDNDFRLKWNGTLSLGDIVILIDDESGKEEFYYFLGYSMDYTNNQLTLNISNKKSLRDNAKTINQYLKEMKKARALLMTNRYLFNATKQNKLNMDDRDVQ